MIAPVTQYEVQEGKFAVQFYMPIEWALDDLPRPSDNRVYLKEVPEKTLLVAKYNGNSDF